jgi:Rrf2 family protein
MAKIIQFPKTISIAFYSLVFLAISERRMNVDEIVTYVNSSKYHTAHILTNLVKNGYLNSTRGPEGGFGLKLPADRIYLLDIWEAVEEKFQIIGCLNDHKACFGDICIFSDKIYNIHYELYNFLAENTIEHLVQKVPGKIRDSIL